MEGGSAVQSSQLSWPGQLPVISRVEALKSPPPEYYYPGPRVQPPDLKSQLCNK